MKEKKRAGGRFQATLGGFFAFLGIMAAATLLCAVLLRRVEGDFHAPLIYVLAVLFISRLTKGFLYGIVASFVSVLCVNYVFTFPYFNFNFTNAGYPIVFVSMLAVSIITSAMTTQIKLQEKTRADAEREATRANLLRAVSHDLRTPLTSIVGATSALLENEENFSPDEKRQLLTEARDEAEWLIRMVENLLSVTKMGAEARLKKEPEAAEEVIAESIVKAQKRLGGIQVEVSVPEEILFVPMDAMLIEQVLINLLENVALHADGATCVWVSVIPEDSMALFQVKDDGPGIPEGELKELFSGYLNKPASRSSDSDKKRNMGIGLSTCMSIINAHGGKMSAANAPEGGAVFKFTLPLEREAEV